jgi:uridine kinase
MMRAVPPVLAIAGPAGAGKSSIADAAAELLGGVVVGLHDSAQADPHAVDLVGLQQRLDAHDDATFVIVEGVFALALPPIRWAARWTVYVDTPLDISLARRALHHDDPRPLLRGYLEHGRDGHARFIAPGRQLADLVVDGTQPVDAVAAQIRRFVRETSPGSPPARRPAGH